MSTITHRVVDPSGSGREFNYTYNEEEVEKILNRVNNAPNPLFKYIMEQMYEDYYYMKVMHDCITNDEQLPQHVFNYLYKSHKE